MKSKLVLFDVGNVLVDCREVESIRRDIAKEVGLRNLNIFNNPKFNTSYGNEFDSYLFYHLVGEAKSCGPEKFKEVYSKHLVRLPWYDDVIDVLSELQDVDDVKIGIFSDLCPMDFQNVKSKGILSMLDYRFLSYSLGSDKLDSRTYDMVEDITGYNGDDIIFLDDNEEIVNLAKSRGWDAICVQGYDLDAICEKLNSIWDY